MNPKVTIIIAAHKQYTMPSDPMYLPLHVGAEGKELDLGYQKDNTGNHISQKNGAFCELTGGYWLWQNVRADYKGLVHYRRHFAGAIRDKNPFEQILSYGELSAMIPKYSVFVPKKRKYYIESLYSHYAHTHYASHLDETRKIIAEQCPSYLASYDKTVNRSYGYMFNMMIMRSDLYDAYYQWLFAILSELEKRIDAQNQELSAFQGRFYGRVSEIIFNVWLEQQITEGRILKREIKELPYIYTEKIDWPRKINSFIKAKFGHQKYEGSF